MDIFQKTDTTNILEALTFTAATLFAVFITGVLTAEETSCFLIA